MQDSISREVARALLVTLDAADAAGLKQRETDSPRAYQSYLRGRFLSGKRGQDDLRKAVEQYEQAISLDPVYALAHAGLADAYASWANSSVAPSSEAYLKARTAALKGLELDDRLADSHAALAVVSLFYDWDWPAAERAFKRAISLDPDNSRARRRYGVGLTWLGRFDEAIRESQRALELDPVDLEIAHNLALVLYLARRYDQAIAEARKTLDLDPHLSQAHRTIARASLGLRLYDQAIAAFRQAIASGGAQILEAELGYAYAVSGRRDEAMKILAELTELAGQRFVSPYETAILHTGLGDPDQAFAWLDKSYAERERFMVSLEVAPMLDPLRSDPRFADLVRRVGLRR